MKITFIQTGGTIDKDYPHTTKGWAFEIDTPAVERILDKLNPSFEYKIIPLLKKDSLEINEADRQLLKDTILEITTPNIIVTHGTDTIIETAQFLADISNKVIILTGAMRPERFSNSEAPINIGMAIGAVQTLKSGVYIAMHGLVLPAHKVDRDLITGKFKKL